MIDLEMVRLCAQAVGYRTRVEPVWVGQPTVRVLDPTIPGTPTWWGYDPINDDCQCFALLKRFHLTVGIDHGNKQWNVHRSAGADPMHAFSTDLNRAIVQCVAHLQQAKAGKGS